MTKQEGIVSKDCSNCRFSKEASPYKVLMRCRIDKKVYSQPHCCDRWEPLIFYKEGMV